MKDRPHSEATTLISALERVVDAALENARKTTDHGKAIDDHQVHSERVSYLATELRAAKALADYAAAVAGEGADDPLGAEAAGIFAANVVARCRAQVSTHLETFGFKEAFLDDTLDSVEVRALVRAAASEERVRALGRRVIAAGGVNQCWLPGELERLSRESVRNFAKTEVEPIAQRIHQQDELVPEELIRKMAELGYFGMSVPEEYGGGGMGNLVMIITTEELSAASLAAAGSLITRPEILTKALLQGGTPEQKKAWLPRIASGELMVAISVTEPDTGSDVASVKCRAEPAEVGGRKGWIINGREGMVHVRGPRGRDRTARAHRSESIERRPRPFAPHRRKGSLHRTRVRDASAERRSHSRQGRSHTRLSRHAFLYARLRELFRSRREPDRR